MCAGSGSVRSHFPALSLSSHEHVRHLRAAAIDRKVDSHSLRLPSQERHQWRSETIKENPEKAFHTVLAGQGKKQPPQKLCFDLVFIYPKEKKKKKILKKENENYNLKVLSH